MKKHKIKSFWQTEKGVWSNKENKFINRIYSKLEEKEIEVTIIDTGDSSPIIKFIGGPTGHESYYLESLMDNDIRGDKLYICAGTINSWPSCYVMWEDLNEIIKEYI